MGLLLLPSCVGWGSHPHIREVAGYIIHSYTVGIVTSCISIEVVGVEKVSMLPLVCRQDDAPLTLEFTHEMSEETR